MNDLTNLDERYDGRRAGVGQSATILIVTSVVLLSSARAPNVGLGDLVPGIKFPDSPTAIVAAYGVFLVFALAAWHHRRWRECLELRSRIVMADPVTAGSPRDQVLWPPLHRRNDRRNRAALRNVRDVPATLFAVAGPVLVACVVYWVLSFDYFFQLHRDGRAPTWGEYFWFDAPGGFRVTSARGDSGSYLNTPYQTWLLVVCGGWLACLLVRELIVAWPTRKSPYWEEAAAPAAESADTKTGIGKAATTAPTAGTGAVAGQPSRVIRADLDRVA